MEKGKGALAGRGRGSGPLAEAGLAHPRSPASARSRPRRVHACGWPRRAAVASQQSSAPRGAHATAWTCPGQPPGAPDRVRLRPRCHLRPPAPPLSLSHPCSARAENRRRHWSSELCLDRSSPAHEPFFDSSLPELRPRFAVVEHASERLVTHGEPHSPSFPSPARAPPPRA